MKCRILLVSLFIFNFFLFSPCTEKDENLINAVKSNNNELVNELLKNGADPNIRMHSPDFTALMLAVSNNNFSIVDMLLNAGADINTIVTDDGGVKGLKGHNALSFTFLDKREKMAKYLINKGINYRYVDGEGLNILMGATYHNMLGLANFLISKDIPINHQTNEGRSVLMIASEKGNIEMVKLFLKHGAKKELKIIKGPKKGFSAIDFAKEKNYSKIVSLLEGI